MKTPMGAPAYYYAVAIVFMLSCCLRCNYCIESFPAVNNPLWFRWLREHRNNNNNEADPVEASASASVSQLIRFADGKEAARRQERGERTINPRRFNGFAFFNDFEITTSTTTTSRPEATTLHYPSQQPQLSNGVTFANLLERARLRTTEDVTLTTPLSSSEVDTTTETTSTTTSSTTSTTTLRPLTTLNELFSSRANSRYKPRAVTSFISPSSQKLVNSRVPESRFVISKRRQSLRSRKKGPPPTTTTTTQPTTTSTTSTTQATTSQTIYSVQTEKAMLVTRTVTSTEEVPLTTTTTYEPEEYTTLPLAKLIYSGQYHEVNPGQYHEVNPGQYHEVNPGQYHEVNPGQYHENNPGQYISEPLNDVQVEVKQTENTKIYNVQSKVDKFIIGEYGTISKESGQTLQGVRYTAVADVSVDPSLIYETLIKYFPMHHHDEGK